MFQVINVGEFFNINIIETFKLILKSFIFFLVFWLDVLDTLQSLLCSFEFLLSSGELVEKFTLILLQLLHCHLHLGHLLGLILDDIADTLLNVNLLSISIEVSGDGIKEFEGLVPSHLQILFLSK